jgi:hypothetical protein
MRRFALIAALAIFASFLWSTAAFASGTDLNTVWTTELLEEGAFQWDLTLGTSNEQYTAFWSEDGRFLTNDFYTTIWKNLEVGMAFNVERNVGPFSLFAKYRVFNEKDGDFPVSLAVGASNIIGTHDRYSSEVIPFIVVGKNFDKFDGYVGFAHNASGVQDDDSLFGGIDYMWNEDWDIVVDFFGYNDTGDSVISGGLYYDLMKHFGLNGWVSYDSGTENTIIVVELAFTGRFDDLKADVEPIQN